MTTPYDVILVITIDAEPQKLCCVKFLLNFKHLQITKCIWTSSHFCSGFTMLPRLSCQFKSSRHKTFLHVERGRFCGIIYYFWGIDQWWIHDMGEYLIGHVVTEEVNPCPCAVPPCRFFGWHHRRVWHKACGMSQGHQDDWQLSLHAVVVATGCTDNPGGHHNKHGGRGGGASV